MLTVSDNHIVLGGGGGVTDHGALTGLADDDHSQYPLSAGRAGGQTLRGDTGVGGNLTLSSTANAAKGKIFLGQNSAFDEVQGFFGVGTTSPTKQFSVSATITTTFGLFSTHNFTNNRNWAFTTNAYGSGNWGGLGIWQSTAAGGDPVNGAISRFGIDVDGKAGFNTAVPTASVDINGDTLRLRTSRTPASSSSPGNQGDMCWGATFSYVATATNTWRMSPTILVGTPTFTGTFQTLTGQTVTVANGIISTVV